MNNFKEQLSKETSCIDNIIEKYLPEAKGHAEYIKSAMDYSVEAGGKRIRPMIMLKLTSCVMVLTRKNCIHLWRLLR